ncbi:MULTISPECIES: helix-turn-helix domain-containing protein [unclassified Pseudomonas]|uniref:helix-turn-helix domain-containing protein n=1 Tax=unclassified Pseudomonas TaxID=196821 RepID=UPI002AC9E75E|nr:MULTISPECIES: XRE family transcriptional regulator [unclassified Pseudomonas]MEB0046841.1 XRE family transcriptional regulator [Pseudomonas sp. Dout3]MEB0099466.1 XRE family transcriptional regulator [Pseudomonas sp. DC1.2]WPX59649.1 XRE family transcriptional regulator [Pseudomonas sp. DC1.2]
MPLRDSLAAVLRLVRSARGLSKDDFHGQLDPKHVYNLENAKTSVTLETLQILASTLKVDPLALLTLAASLDRKQTHDELLEHLSKEVRMLSDLGVVADWPSQFENGALLSMRAGTRTPPEKIEAVLICRARGMTQKQTATELGIPSSTVNRIWNRKEESK